jgi:hypothetical protein
MIEIRKASIEFVGGVSPQIAEEIVTEALRLAARRFPHRAGKVRRLTLPAIEIGPDVDARTFAEALSDALVRGIADAPEVRDV